MTILYCYQWESLETMFNNHLFYKHLMKACLAAAFALGLAACGGSDPATPPTDQGTTDQGTTDQGTTDPAPTVDVTIPDQMYLDEDNMPMAGTLSIKAGETSTSGGVIFSCPADGEDCEVTIADDGSVTSTGGAATAALTDDATKQVAQAKKEAKDEADRAALENRDRIIGKDKALEAAANIGTNGGPAEAAIIINRGPSGPASVTSAGYTMSDDPALPNGDVWIGSHLTQTDGGNTNHLFVYTDKEPATRIQFYNWDGDATTPSLYADTVTDALTSPATTATTITPLALDTGGGTGQAFSESVADLTRFPRAQSPKEGDNAQTYPINDASTAGGTIDRVSIPGNFNGAGGRYLCTPASGTSCSVTVDPTGAYASGDTWTFVPELNSTAWIEDGGTAAGAGGGQQGEFMSFGWWLQEPTAQTGVYTFRYYADGAPYQLPAAAVNLAAGSATYNGRAAGKFVVQELDDGGVIGGEAGMFTAAAALTATFDGTAANGALEGTISGFQSDNAAVNVSGWEVTLNEQEFDIAVTTDVTTTGQGATAEMGDQTANGSWSAQFFGQPDTANAYPLGVGGTFQADNEDVSIAGAFGARR